MLLFLYGPDTYRSRQKVRDIIFGYKKAHADAVHVKNIDCGEATVEDLKNEIESISMFEKKKLLILRNALHNATIEAFLEEKKKELEKSERHIIVLWETEEIKGKTKNPLYQWLKKHAKAQEFLLLSPQSLKAWIAREFGQYGVKIEPKATEQLARTVGNDLWKLEQEVRKLAAFKGSEGSVKEADVALLVKAKVEADVFATIDSMAQRDKKKALELLSNHLIKGDSPHYLLTMFLYQFRTIIEIRDMMDQQISPQIMAQRSGLHPYVLKKGLRVAQHFSLDELRAIYEKLFRLDTAFKTGRTEPGGALNLFVASL